MITPELIEYIRGEFAKGRTREEVRAELVRGGGWTEEDLNEAFRTVVPMQDFAQSPVIGKNPSLGQSFSPGKKKSHLGDIIFIIFGLICVFSWLFYRPQIINFWNSAASNLPEFSLPSFTFDRVMDFFSKSKTQEIAVIPQNNITENVSTPKDCGIGLAPDLNNPPTYQNNNTLTCLGNEALVCQSGAKAILKDPLFPSDFQIINDRGACDFKLSYGQDSTLVDITGNKLAGQYIMCPVSIVKAINETEKVTSFSAPSLDNPSKYASQIYFYGTLGLFIENNLEKNKIQSLGCSGPYIDSVIASYKKTL